MTNMFPDVYINAILYGFMAYFAKGMFIDMRVFCWKP